MNLHAPGEAAVGRFTIQRAAAHDEVVVRERRRLAIRQRADHALMLVPRSSPGPHPDLAEHVIFD